MWRQHFYNVCTLWFALRRRCQAPGHMHETDSGAWSSAGTCGWRLHQRLPPLWLWCTNTWEWLPHPGQGTTDRPDSMHCSSHDWYLNCDRTHAQIIQPFMTINQKQTFCLDLYYFVLKTSDNSEKMVSCLWRPALSSHKITVSYYIMFLRRVTSPPAYNRLTHSRCLLNQNHLYDSPVRRNQQCLNYFPAPSGERGEPADLINQYRYGSEQQVKSK